MTDRHLARVLISRELIIEALHLPEDTKLIGIKDDLMYNYGTFEFVIENDDLPTVCEGAAIQRIYPVFHRDDDGNITMESWGIE